MEVDGFSGALAAACFVSCGSCLHPDVMALARQAQMARLDRFIDILRAVEMPWLGTTTVVHILRL